MLLKDGEKILHLMNESKDIVNARSEFLSYLQITCLAIPECTNFNEMISDGDNIYISPSSYKIQKDDIIIMCSDGMIDDTNKNIESILEDVCNDDPSTICNILFNHLIEIRQNTDDATLAVITIN